MMVTTAQPPNCFEIPKNKGIQFPSRRLIRLVSSKGFALSSKEKNCTLTKEDLAFDHSEIIQTALDRLKGKVKYSDIALELLADKEKFSIYELQRIYEAIAGEKVDTANFRRSFRKKFIDTGRVEKLEEKCSVYSKKPSSYYKLLG